MVRVLLCSQEPVLAAGLATVLASAEGFELASVCASLADARTLVKSDEGSPVLLLDLTAESGYGLMGDLDRSLLERKIVLWVREISSDLALYAMSAGVRGILRSTLGPELLLRCLERVYQGEIWFEKALVDNFLGGRRAALTRREAQLVRLLSQGLKNKEIAANMMISEGTVKVYLSRLFHKVGVKDRFALALYAMKHPHAPLRLPPRPRRA